MTTQKGTNAAATGPAPAPRALAWPSGDIRRFTVEVGPELVGQAMSSWLMRFEDQPFSPVDAVSFQVMRAEKVTAAFAFDHHFEVAGFELLR